MSTPFAEPFAGPPGLQQQAATPVAGTALVNGVPNIISWTAPNDGALHLALVSCAKQVTVLEAGGAIALDFTAPDGVARAFSVFAGGAAAGDYSNLQVVNVKAGTGVVVAQSSALTAGASTVWAAILGL